MCNECTDKVLVIQQVFFARWGGGQQANSSEASGANCTKSGQIQNVTLQHKLQIYY